MTTRTAPSAATTTPRRAGLRKLLFTETRLYLREPLTAFFTIGLPLGLLLVLGSAIPGFRDPDPALGGERIVDGQLPAMMILLSAMTSAFSVMPAVLAVYRERGVLRRLSVTPASPAALLATQLLLNLATTVVAAILTVVGGHLVLGTRLPGQVPWFVLVFLLGVTALFAIGLAVAAVVPNSRVAGGLGAVVMFPMLFLAGMWLPRDLMPEFLRRISDFTPAGAFGQALRDSWGGATPQALHVAVIVAWALAADVFAARAFRWE
ncbi:ABC transporter permease [Sphaerisporangium corydalis]|uniref:Transport permease protein n=1 Tax=Sphaerisporangium corydalis TaxID=1441875 RepID=A0ABV9EEU1_9ACTN|nr:ABC transporter permease [Sphaerisporangium corydalis]